MNLIGTKVLEREKSIKARIIETESGRKTVSFICVECSRENSVYHPCVNQGELPFCLIKTTFRVVCSHCDSVYQGLFLKNPEPELICITDPTFLRSENRQMGIFSENANRERQQIRKVTPAWREFVNIQLFSPDDIRSINRALFDPRELKPISTVKINPRKDFFELWLKEEKSTPNFKVLGNNLILDISRSSWHQSKFNLLGIIEEIITSDRVAKSNPMELQECFLREK